VLHQRARSKRETGTARLEGDDDALILKYLSPHVGSNLVRCDRDLDDAAGEIF
jgi:hypothetical protein